MKKQQIKILLVHGSGHDSSCWNLLIPYLIHYEYDVHVLNLSSHGSEFTNPWFVSMNTYANDVCNMTQRIGGPLILVGHSMGGFVISMAAEKNPGLFEHLIYLTAAVPDKKGSNAMSSMRDSEKMNLKGKIKFRPLQGICYYSPNHAAQMFYNMCSQEIRAKAPQKLVKQPIRPLLAKLEWTQKNLGSVKKSYIECTNDNALNISFQRSMRQSMDFFKIVSLKSDHSPFLSMPEKLAEAMDEIIKS